MTPKEIIAAKLTSGKFLLTIMAGMVFIYGSVRGIIPQDKITEIILIIVYAYFTKHKENGGEQK